VRDVRVALAARLAIGAKTPGGLRRDLVTPLLRNLATLKRWRVLCETLRRAAVCDAFSDRCEPDPVSESARRGSGESKP